jgi:hypothetical protein
MALILYIILCFTIFTSTLCTCKETWLKVIGLIYVILEQASFIALIIVYAMAINVVGKVDL